MSQAEEVKKTYRELAPTVQEKLSEAVNHMPDDKFPSQILAFFHPEEDMDEIYEYDIFIERLSRSVWFTYKTFHEGLNMVPVYEIEYKGSIYEFDLYFEKVDWNRLGKVESTVTYEQMIRMQETENTVILNMHFGENAEESYHLQWKILYCLFPEMIGAADYNTGKIVSADRIKHIVESETPPDADYRAIVESHTIPEDYDPFAGWEAVSF